MVSEDEKYRGDLVIVPNQVVIDGFPPVEDSSLNYISKRILSRQLFHENPPPASSSIE